MLTRYPARSNAPPNYSTLTSQKSSVPGPSAPTLDSRTDHYASLRQQQAPSAMSHASHQSVTATSTML